MADETIDDQSSKAAPDLTDNFWLQETGDGAGYKASLKSILRAVFFARGSANGVGQQIQTGAVNVLSVTQVSTGVYDWNLNLGVTSVDTAQCIAHTTGISGGASPEISAKMQTADVCRVTITLGSTRINQSHCLMIFDEA